MSHDHPTPPPVEMKPQDHWTTVGAVKAARALIKAADDLCFTAETTGGTAGRDTALCLAVAHWIAERDKQKQVLRIIELEGHDPEVGVGYELCPIPKPQADHSEDILHMVTPRDREAYLAFNTLPKHLAADVRAGRWDHTTGMQVIARHRLAHSAPAPVEVTQADRDRAEAFWQEYGPFRMGTVSALSAAFARHRMAHSAPAGEVVPVAAQDVAALVEAAKWCADDLESEIRSRWIEPNTGLPHPANQHRYDRDMETVRDLRTALAKHGGA